jgi:hypothetical protein
MNDRKAWLLDWCTQNIRYHRGISFAMHCACCKAELKGIPLDAVSPDIDCVPIPRRRISNPGRVADVVGVIFPAVATRAVEITCELTKFELKNDDTDAARLCEFLLAYVEKYAPQAH